MAQGAGRERSRLLNRLADLVEEHGQELAELESLDNGKPVSYAGQVDVALTIAHFRLLRRLADEDRG